MKYTLIPFSPTPYPLSIEADKSLINKGKQTFLTVTYVLTGEWQHISLLPPSPATADPSTHTSPSSVVRKHELWKDTCFEWFLRFPEEKKYWEFNAAPTKEWNFYELADYRQNLQEYLPVPPPKLLAKERERTHRILATSHSIKNEIKENDDKLKLSPKEHGFLFSAELDLTSLWLSSSKKEARLAITTIIRWKSGETSYFSLKHPPEKPDFHSPEGFSLSLSYSH